MSILEIVEEAKVLRFFAQIYLCGIRTLEMSKILVFVGHGELLDGVGKLKTCMKL